MRLGIARGGGWPELRRGGPRERVSESKGDSPMGSYFSRPIGNAVRGRRKV